MELESCQYLLPVHPCSVAAVYSSSVTAPANRMEIISQSVILVLSWSAMCCCEFRTTKLNVPQLSSRERHSTNVNNSSPKFRNSRMAP